MRLNRQSLLTLLEAFIYDPLVDWTLDSHSYDQQMTRSIELTAKFNYWSIRVDEKLKLPVESFVSKLVSHLSIIRPLLDRFFALDWPLLSLFQRRRSLVSALEDLKTKGSQQQQQHVTSIDPSFDENFSLFSHYRSLLHPSSSLQHFSSVLPSVFSLFGVVCDDETDRINDVSSSSALTTERTTQRTLAEMLMDKQAAETIRSFMQTDIIESLKQRLSEALKERDPKERIVGPFTVDDLEQLSSSLFTDLLGYQHNICNIPQYISSSFTDPLSLSLSDLIQRLSAVSETKQSLQDVLHSLSALHNASFLSTKSSTISSIASQRNTLVDIAATLRSPKQERDAIHDLVVSLSPSLSLPPSLSPSLFHPLSLSFSLLSILFLSRSLSLSPLSLDRKSVV